MSGTARQGQAPATFARDAQHEAIRGLAYRAGDGPAVPPCPLTSFIGREREAEAVLRLLAASRLLTLTGPGGVGKTRLALRVAAQARDRFADGVVYQSLAPLTDPELVAPTILHTLRLREVDDEAPADTLARFLRDKHLLLVLDNFEHLLAAAPMVVGLLERCPGLTVLATSRSVLRVSGERRFLVPPLELPEPGCSSSPGQLSACEAVRLFVERARDARPDFALTEDDAMAVAEICRRLDGLPLAIELAAARIDVLPPRAILARLENRLALLTAGARDRPARQQTLRATTAWSHGLLDPAEQTLFRRLAVFGGGCTVEAAEAVGGDGDGRATTDEPRPALAAVPRPTSVLDRLVSLVDKSLLAPQTTAAGETRFAMLETVREYALEQLATSGEAAAVARRHAGYCVALAEEIEPRLYGAEQVRWFRRLDLEYSNLRAALWWLLEQGTPASIEQGLRLCGALWWYWHGRGYQGEPRIWFTAFLGLPGAPSDGRWRARALLCAALAAWKLGDHRAARTHAEEILAHAREAGDAPITASGHLLFGMSAMNLGRLADARSAFDDVIAMGRQLEGEWHLGWGLNFQGIVALILGEPDVARALLEESLAVRRRTGDQKGMAWALYGLAALARLRGDAATAYELYAEGLACVRELEDWPTIAMVLDGLGAAALGRGDFAAARAHFGECLTVYRNMGSMRGIGLALQGFAATAAAEGQSGRAVRLAGAASALTEAGGIAVVVVRHPDLEQWIASARQALGELAAAAWAEGRTMPLEAAVAHALGVAHPAKQPAGAPTGHAGRGPAADAGRSRAGAKGGLTRREREVGALIARGLSNRQIADELVIGERTVEMHVSNLLAKLDFTSRAQVAVWVTEQGLPDLPQLAHVVGFAPARTRPEKYRTRSSVSTVAPRSDTA